MVTISTEAPATTEARLRALFRDCAVRWLPGSWAFVEGDAADARDDAVARVWDEGRVSALAPVLDGGAPEAFEVFRVVLPPGRDDSGFVGWLTTLIKQRTGSGVVVICGQDSARGGIFDYYAVPVAAAEPVRDLVAGLAEPSTAGDLDGVTMRPYRVADGSPLTDDTVFVFEQESDRVRARYGGGAIADGWLLGSASSASHGAWDFVQRSSDGATRTGRSTFEVRRLDDGSLELEETFSWAGGSGVNVFRQDSGSERSA